MLEVTIVPSADQLEITTSAGIGLPETVTDITKGDDSVYEVLAVTAPGPESPANLSASSLGDFIMLSWTDNSSDEQSDEQRFRIDRRLSTDTAWTTIHDGLALDSTEYFDEAITRPGNSYRVYAVNENGSSLPSTIASTTAVGGGTGISESSSDIDSSSDGGGGGGSMDWFFLLFAILLSLRGAWAQVRGRFKAGIGFIKHCITR